MTAIAKQGLEWTLQSHRNRGRPKPRKEIWKRNVDSRFRYSWRKMDTVAQD